MTAQVFQVDAFTDAPFTGNPAGVCLLPRPATAAWMQHLAYELNWPETAFVVPQGEDFSVRWFTPVVEEMNLCGHATLACAHVLFEQAEIAARSRIRFHSRHHELISWRDGATIAVDFPALPALPVDAVPVLSQALAAAPLNIAKNEFDYLVELHSEEAVRALKPDMAQLANVPMRGVIVTSRAAPGRSYDIVSRFFAPRLGIPEDAVTGSAHCTLAPYWAHRLEKSELVGFQASTRGGMVRMRHAGGTRVVLMGEAITILRAQLPEQILRAAM